MISIEKYQAADFDALTVMIGRLQEYERQIHAGLKPPSVVADAYTKDLVEIADNERGLVLIARDDNQIIGCVAGYLREDDDPCLEEAARVYGNVCDLYVADKWRMRGVGRLLLTAIEEQMKRRGAVALRATTRALNTVAVSCLADSGYAPLQLVLAKELQGIQ